jgi:ankyrin repeat protein
MGWILLHLTPCSSDLDLVQFLLEHRADMSAEAKDGSTPLHGASASGNVDLAQFLVEPWWRRRDIQGRGWAGSASLGIVSRSFSLDLTWFLVKHSADVSAKDNTGWTPIIKISHGSSSSSRSDVTPQATSQIQQTACMTSKIILGSIDSRILSYCTTLQLK